MSASFFKKSLGASHIKITVPRTGDRSFDDTAMDDEYDRKSYGGYGPRPAQHRGRGGNFRGRGRSNRFEAFSQHDDRDDRSVTQRLGDRVGYKGRGRDRRGRRGGGYRGGDRGRHHNRGGQNHLHDNYTPTSVSKGPQWYQVTIPYGRKADKEFIFKEINELLDTIPFIPTSFRYEGQAAIFYVEMTFTSIEALRAVNNRITFPNGFKMTLTIKQQDPPVPKVIEGALLEKLVTVMSGLYDTDMHMLDLSSFHKNEGLKPDVLPLSKNAVMTTVVNVIAEHIPEVKLINLCNNRLSNLSNLSALVTKAPAVIALDLSNNEIRDAELDRLKGWNIKELKLSGTPIAKRYGNNTAEYLTFIRKRFPQVLMLDEVAAPPVIGIEVEEDTGKKLPIRVNNYFGDDTGIQPLVLQFVQQYIELFDSKDRTNLIDAYHENVTFSTSFWFWPNDDRQPRFDITNSRNLIRVTDDKNTRVQYGRGVVVSYLAQEFPYTKHLLETLNIDLVHHTEQLISFTLTGLYEEPNPSKATQVTRYFSRTFTVVPQGPGLAIVSEQFSFTNCSPSKRSLLLSAANSRLTAPDPVPTAGPSTTATSTPTGPLEPQQEALLQKFMADSGMNAFWSKECLVANNYDYAGAAAMFSGLKAEGKIPADAFQ